MHKISSTQRRKKTSSSSSTLSQFSTLNNISPNATRTPPSTQNTDVSNGKQHKRLINTKVQQKRLVKSLLSDHKSSNPQRRNLTTINPTLNKDTQNNLFPLTNPNITLATSHLTQSPLHTSLLGFGTSIQGDNEDVKKSKSSTHFLKNSKTSSSHNKQSTKTTQQKLSLTTQSTRHNSTTQSPLPQSPIRYQPGPEHNISVYLPPDLQEISYSTHHPSRQLVELDLVVPFPPEAQKVIDVFRAVGETMCGPGTEIRIAGGWVRDLLRSHKEFHCDHTPRISQQVFSSSSLYSRINTPRLTHHSKSFIQQLNTDEIDLSNDLEREDNQYKVRSDQLDEFMKFSPQVPTLLESLTNKVFLRNYDSLQNSQKITNFTQNELDFMKNHPYNDRHNSNNNNNNTPHEDTQNETSSPTTSTLLKQKQKTLKFAENGSRDLVFSPSYLEHTGKLGDVDIAVNNMTGSQLSHYLLSYCKDKNIPCRIQTVSSDYLISRHLATARGSMFDTVSIDIVNLRTETYVTDAAHRVPTMGFGGPQDDASRRDFTSNALFYNISTNKIEDWNGGAGLDDLRLGRLRTPLDPQSIFLDDPLRILRVVRFSTRLGFLPSIDLFKAAHMPESMHGLLYKVSRERIGKEVTSSFVHSGLNSTERGSLFFFTQLLTSLNALPSVFPLKLVQDARMDSQRRQLGVSSRQLRKDNGVWKRVTEVFPEKGLPNAQDVTSDASNSDVITDFTSNGSLEPVLTWSPLMVSNLLRFAASFEHATLALEHMFILAQNNYFSSQNRKNRQAGDNQEIDTDNQIKLIQNGNQITSTINTSTTLNNNETVQTPSPLTQSPSTTQSSLFSTGVDPSVALLAARRQIEKDIDDLKTSSRRDPLIGQLLLQQDEQLLNGHTDNVQPVVEVKQGKQDKNEKMKARLMRQYVKKLQKFDEKIAIIDTQLNAINTIDISTSDLTRNDHIVSMIGLLPALGKVNREHLFYLSAILSLHANVFAQPFQPYSPILNQGHHFSRRQLGYSNDEDDLDMNSVSGKKKNKRGGEDRFFPFLDETAQSYASSRMGTSHLLDTAYGPTTIQLNSKKQPKVGWLSGTAEDEDGSNNNNANDGLNDKNNNTISSPLTGINTLDTTNFRNLITRRTLPPMISNNPAPAVLDDERATLKPSSTDLDEETHRTALNSLKTTPKSAQKPTLGPLIEHSLPSFDPFTALQNIPLDISQLNNSFRFSALFLAAVQPRWFVPKSAIHAMRKGPRWLSRFDRKDQAQVTEGGAKGSDHTRVIDATNGENSQDESTPLAKTSSSSSSSQSLQSQPAPFRPKSVPFLWIDSRHELTTHYWAMGVHVDVSAQLNGFVSEYFRQQDEVMRAESEAIDDGSLSIKSYDVKNTPQINFNKGQNDVEKDGEQGKSGENVDNFAVHNDNSNSTSTASKTSSTTIQSEQPVPVYVYFKPTSQQFPVSVQAHLNKHRKINSEQQHHKNLNTNSSSTNDPNTTYLDPSEQSFSESPYHTNLFDSLFTPITTAPKLPNLSPTDPDSKLTVWGSIPPPTNPDGSPTSPNAYNSNSNYPLAANTVPLDDSLSPLELSTNEQYRVQQRISQFNIYWKQPRTGITNVVWGTKPFIDVNPETLRLQRAIIEDNKENSTNMKTSNEHNSTSAIASTDSTDPPQHPIQNTPLFNKYKSQLDNQAIQLDHAKNPLNIKNNVQKPNCTCKLCTVQYNTWHNLPGGLPHMVDKAPLLWVNNMKPKKKRSRRGDDFNTTTTNPTDINTNDGENDDDNKKQRFKVPMDIDADERCLVMEAMTEHIDVCILDQHGNILYDSQSLANRSIFNTQDDELINGFNKDGSVDLNAVVDESWKFQKKYQIVGQNVPILQSPSVDSPSSQPSSPLQASQTLSLEQIYRFTHHYIYHSHRFHHTKLNDGGLAMHYLRLGYIREEKQRQFEEETKKNSNNMTNDDGNGNTEENEGDNNLDAVQNDDISIKSHAKNDLNSAFSPDSPFIKADGKLKLPSKKQRKVATGSGSQGDASLSNRYPMIPSSDQSWSLPRLGLRLDFDLDFAPVAIPRGLDGKEEKSISAADIYNSLNQQNLIEDGEMNIDSSKKQKRVISFIPPAPSRVAQMLDTVLAVAQDDDVSSNPTQTRSQSQPSTNNTLPTKSILPNPIQPVFNLHNVFWVAHYHPQSLPRRLMAQFPQFMSVSVHGRNSVLLDDARAFFDQGLRREHSTVDELMLTLKTGHAIATVVIESFFLKQVAYKMGKQNQKSRDGTTKRSLGFDPLTYNPVNDADIIPLYIDEVDCIEGNGPSQQKSTKSIKNHTQDQNDGSISPHNTQTVQSNDNITSFINELDSYDITDTDLFNPANVFDTAIANIIHLRRNLIKKSSKPVPKSSNPSETTDYTNAAAAPLPPQPPKDRSAFQQYSRDMIKHMLFTSQHQLDPITNKYKPSHKHILTVEQLDIAFGIEDRDVNEEGVSLGSLSDELQDSNTVPNNAHKSSTNQTTPSFDQPTVTMAVSPAVASFSALLQSIRDVSLTTPLILANSILTNWKNSTTQSMVETLSDQTSISKEVFSRLPTLVTPKPSLDRQMLLNNVDNTLVKNMNSSTFHGNSTPSSHHNQHHVPKTTIKPYNLVYDFAPPKLFQQLLHPTLYTEHDESYTLCQSSFDSWKAQNQRDNAGHNEPSIQNNQNNNDITTSSSSSSHPPSSPSSRRQWNSTQLPQSDHITTMTEHLVQDRFIKPFLVTMQQFGLMSIANKDFTTAMLDLEGQELRNAVDAVLVEDLNVLSNHGFNISTKIFSHIPGGLIGEDMISGNNNAESKKKSEQTTSPKAKSPYNGQQQQQQYQQQIQQTTESGANIEIQRRWTRDWSCICGGVLDVALVLRAVLPELDRSQITVIMKYLLLSTQYQSLSSQLRWNNLPRGDNNNNGNANIG